MSEEKARLYQFDAGVFQKADRLFQLLSLIEQEAKTKSEPDEKKFVMIEAKSRKKKEKVPGLKNKTLNDNRFR